jgi:hypothetical protein
MIEQCKESALNCEKMREEIIQLYKDGKMSKKVYFLNIKHMAKLIKSNNDLLTTLPQKYQLMLKCKNTSSAGRDMYLPDMESCLENKKYTNKFLVSTH